MSQAPTRRTAWWWIGAVIGRLILVALIPILLAGYVLVLIVEGLSWLRDRILHFLERIVGAVERS